MANHDIIIIDSKRGNDYLKLKDGDEIMIDVEDTVTWSINTSDVASFKIKKKHFLIREIFTDAPSQDYGTSLQRQVKSDVFDRRYKYSIVWKDKDWEKHTYDPIISINPDWKRRSKKDSIIPWLVPFLGLLGISLLLSLKKKSSK